MDCERKKIYLVSSCLMGLNTRYDATAKASEQCREFVEGAIWVPVCPEQLGGMPTPRLPSALEGGQGNEVLSGKARVVNRDGVDVTRHFIDGAHQVLFVAKKLGVDGVLLKSRSPSCGCGQVLGVTAALLQANGFSVQEF